MKAKIEDVVTQVKGELDLEATYIEKNRNLFIHGDKEALILWFSAPEPGVFNTDDLEESASINQHDDRFHTHSIEDFDVETMEEFLAKVKEILQI